MRVVRENARGAAYICSSAGHSRRPSMAAADLGDLYMQGVEAVPGDCPGCVWQRPWYDMVRRWLREARVLRARGPVPRTGWHAPGPGFLLPSWLAHHPGPGG